MSPSPRKQQKAQDIPVSKEWGAANPSNEYQQPLVGPVLLDGNTAITIQMPINTVAFFLLNKQAVNNNIDVMLIDTVIVFL